MLDGLGLILLIMLVVCWGRTGRDDSDGKERSGLIVYTDNLTGCQYLGTVVGAITPRLDKDGKIVCRKD